MVGGLVPAVSLFDFGKYLPAVCGCSGKQYKEKVSRLLAADDSLKVEGDNLDLWF